MKTALCACVGVLVSASVICGCASQQSLATAAAPEPAAPPASVVTEVVPMRHWSVTSTKWVLDQHAPPAATFEIDDEANSVIIHGTPEDVQRTREILSQIDRPC